MNKSLNFVHITVVLKNGDTLTGKARDFLYHAMDNEFVIDWVDEKPRTLTIDEIENFMVSR